LRRGKQLFGAFCPAQLCSEREGSGPVVALQIGTRAPSQEVSEPVELAPLHQDVERAFAAARIPRIDDRRTGI
jgi:hypothetical protein